MIWGGRVPNSLGVIVTVMVLSLKERLDRGVAMHIG